MVEPRNDAMPRDNIAVTPLKRPHPPGQDGPQKVIKRRASGACRTCRARKVRCDMAINGVPCTNCRLDGHECVVLLNKRGPKSRSTPSQPSSALRNSHGTTHVHGSCTRDTAREESNRAEAAPISPVSSSQGKESTRQAQPSLSHTADYGALEPRADSIYDVAVGLTFDHDEDGTNSRGSHGDGDTVASGLRANTGPSPSWSDQSRGHIGRLGGKPSSPRDEPALPGFIFSLPSTLADDDIAFLEHKGALTIPDAATRDEIIRTYLSVIHQFMPIIDVRAFLTALVSDGQSGKISILLFQAVMFAGLSGLDPQSVHRMGFENVKAARHVFYNRVRLLHDFDVEPDDTALLQTLLLMSLWYGGRDQPKNTWYYTGLALSQAQCMGLHQEPDRTRSDWQLRRRLWWGLVIRDRLIALGTRRPMRIRDTDHELAMLSLSDFDCSPLDESLAKFSEPGVLLSDGSGECLALMCVELAKLCICIGDVLTSQYTVFGRRSPWSRSLMVVPRQAVDSHVLVKELKRLDSSIAAWNEGLPLEVAKAATPGTTTRCIAHHATILQMVRLTLLSLLHRPQCLQALPTDVSKADQTVVEFLKSSKTRLKATARDLTRLIQVMLQHDMIRFMPTSGIPILLSASMTHLLDLDAQDDDVRDASIYRLELVMRAFRQLREIYASADSAVTYLGMIIRKTGKGAREQVAMLAPEFDPNAVVAGDRSMPGNSRKDGAATCQPGLIGNGLQQYANEPRNHPRTTTRHDSAGQRGHSHMLGEEASQQGAATTSSLTDLTELAIPDAGSKPRNGSSNVVSVSARGGGDSTTMLSFDNGLDPLASLDYDAGPELFGAQYSLFGADFSWFASAGDDSIGAEFGGTELSRDFL